MDDNSPFDVSRFRVAQDFDQSAGVRRLLTTVRVRKPNRFEFVRVHPDAHMCLEPAAIIEEPDTREPYLVDGGMVAALGDVVKFVSLFVTISRQRTMFLWPVGLPAHGRTNTWHESARDAALLARQEWVRISSNMSAGCYDVVVPVVPVPEPEWPDLALNKLLELAFKGRIIDKPDHPILLRLRGEI